MPSNSDWRTLGKFTLIVGLLTSVPIYVCQHLFDIPFGTAALAHAILVGGYVGLVLLFGVGSGIEAAVAIVVFALVLSVVASAYSKYAKRQGKAFPALGFSEANGESAKISLPKCRRMG